MSPETFLEKFDLIADAPGAVAKMRELILELAVTGKLVAQTPNDDSLGDASSLSLHEVEKPFDVPTNWKWNKLGSIALIERGGSPRPIKDYLTDKPNGHNWIKIGDTERGGKYITSTAEKIRPEGLSKTRKVYPGDFLLTNSMSFGRPYISKIEGCIHDGWLRIHPPEQLEADYLYYLLSSPYVFGFFSKAAAGAVVQNLNADKVRDLIIPLPPLAEQKRIVAKVDELMALCDRLEQQQTERETQHTALSRASLTRFSEAPTPENLHYLFHPTYTTTPADLRKTILTLAIQGKLVPQDPNDEGVDTLETKIRDEKQRLNKAGKAGKTVQFAPISEDSQPYEIPDSWSWVPLGNITFIRTGKLDANASSPDGKYPFFTCARDPLRIDRFAYECECVLLAGNGNFDVNYYDGKFEAYQRTYIIEGVSREMIDGRFLYRFIQVYSEKLREMSLGGVISYIKIGFLTDAPFPLPPLAEQKRIVAKVDELMKLVDQLEAQLTTARTTAENLLNALLADLTSPKAA
jgi:type I restriction enzyme S subunit